jgi:hypothetical protein
MKFGVNLILSLQIDETWRDRNLVNPIIQPALFTKLRFCPAVGTKAESVMNNAGLLILFYFLIVTSCEIYTDGPVFAGSERSSTQTS